MDYPLSPIEPVDNKHHTAVDDDTLLFKSSPPQAPVTEPISDDEDLDPEPVAEPPSDSPLSEPQLAQDVDSQIWFRDDDDESHEAPGPHSCGVASATFGLSYEKRRPHACWLCGAVMVPNTTSAHCMGQNHLDQHYFVYCAKHKRYTLRMNNDINTQAPDADTLPSAPAHCPCLSDHTFPLSAKVDAYFFIRSQSLDRRYALLMRAASIPRPLMDYVIRSGMAHAAWPELLLHTCEASLAWVGAKSRSWAFFATHFKFRKTGVAAFVAGYKTGMTVDELNTLATQTGLLGIGHPATAGERLELAETRRRLFHGAEKNVAPTQQFSQKGNDTKTLTEAPPISTKAPRKNEGDAPTTLTMAARPRGQALDTDTKRKKRSGLSYSGLL